MSRPKIVIGVPCYGDVASELLEDWMRFAYHCGRRMPDYDFFVAIKRKSEQFRARNAIVEEAQRICADWLLFLDDDMIVGIGQEFENSAPYAFIERLLSHGKDICGALYYQRTGGGCPVAMMKADEKGYRFLHDDEITHGLQQVDVAGGGCLLIKMSLFDRLPFPYFAPEFQYGTDIQLCRAAAEKGFEVWWDSSIELGHIKDERTIVSSRNRSLTGATGDMQHHFISTDIYDRLLRDAIAYTGYRNIEEMSTIARGFMASRKEFTGADQDWYRLYPKERVARQVWYNTLHDPKRRMTQFVLSSIDPKKPLRILDFGCGISVLGLTLAEKGHHVTACDVRGTGTLEFLKWRAAQHHVSIDIIETTADCPDLGDAPFDMIIAMDCLEHIQTWPDVLSYLSDRLVPNGFLFCNNGILIDDKHPEHYFADPDAFIVACVQRGLRPYNLLTYQKAVKVPTSRPAVLEMSHA